LFGEFANSISVAESLHRDALKAVVIPATARRAEHALAASSQIRMLASVKGLLTHANGIGYTPFNRVLSVRKCMTEKMKHSRAEQCIPSAEWRRHRFY
jgi:hypothetical protein